jgi:aryl-alcohol dehydrogenase-like predicted oxidoreductase
MEYRFLSRTGLKVSELCLGAITFGREAREDTRFQIMDRFLEVGGNFIDTANVYSRGLSEEAVGKWLKGKNRDNFVIATKERFSMGEGPNEIGLSRKHILSGVRACGWRLNKDQMSRLYKASEVQLPYPYSVSSWNRRR